MLDGQTVLSVQAPAPHVGWPQTIEALALGEASYGDNQARQSAIHGKVAEKFEARRLDLRHLA
jgi:hypothetical protein